MQEEDRLQIYSMISTPHYLCSINIKSLKELQCWIVYQLGLPFGCSSEIRGEGWELDDAITSIIEAPNTRTEGVEVGAEEGPKDGAREGAEECSKEGAEEGAEEGECTDGLCDDDVEEDKAGGERIEEDEEEEEKEEG